MSNLKTVGIPLQEVGLIICTIMQVKYLYFDEELAIGSPKKSRSLQHSWFDSSALETGYTIKSFCASLSFSKKASSACGFLPCYSPKGAAQV